MVRVREATREDAPAIAAINVRGWQAAFRGLFPDEFLDGLAPRTAVWSERVTAGPPDHMAVAIDDHEVVGFVSLAAPDAEDVDAERVHELKALYIEPDRIGTGVGRILMDHALDTMRAGGWDHAILWTLRDVDRTCRFYEAAGWYRDGEERDWELPEGNNVALVRYRFDLAHDPASTARET